MPGAEHIEAHVEALCGTTDIGDRELALRLTESWAGSRVLQLDAMTEAFDHFLRHVRPGAPADPKPFTWAWDAKGAATDTFKLPKVDDFRLSISFKPGDSVPDHDQHKEEWQLFYAEQSRDAPVMMPVLVRLVRLKGVFWLQVVSRVGGAWADSDHKYFVEFRLGKKLPRFAVKIKDTGHLSSALGRALQVEAKKGDDHEWQKKIVPTTPVIKAETCRVGKDPTDKLLPLWDSAEMRVEVSGTQVGS